MDISNGKAERMDRFRTPYLVEQARYILALARSDPAVAKVAGPGLLADVAADLTKLEALKGDWEQARFESRKSTMHEDRAARDAALWIAAFRRFYTIGLHRGSGLPSLSPGPPSTSRNSARLALEIERLIDLARQHAAVLVPFGITADFVARGEEVGKVLNVADEKQEVARHATMKDRIAAVRLQKARLYYGLRQVIAVARTVHAADPSKAGQYNLDILRRGLVSPGPETAAPPPAAAAG